MYVRPTSGSLIKKYNASRETLYELFNKLNKNGADRWVKGHFVAGSALVFPQTLEYILRNASGDFKMLSARLLIYFARNETVEIE